LYQTAAFGSFPFPACKNATNLGINPIISYLFIAVVIKYSLLEDGGQKGGVPETEMVQKRQFITTFTFLPFWGYLPSIYLLGIYH